MTPSILAKPIESQPIEITQLFSSQALRLDMLRDAIEPILGRGDLRRGVLFGLGAFLILGVLILLLSQPTISPAQIIVVSVLMLVSVVATLVMDLFD